MASSPVLAAAPERLPSRWTDVAEKGTRLGIRFLLALRAIAGRRGVRLFLRFLALHYALLHRGVRRASAEYLGRILGRPARLRDVWRHVLTFAEVAFDRVTFLRGETGGLELVSHGGFALLEARRATGRGALLLGAHLGSFEAMRVRSEERALPIHALVYERNARMVSAFLRAISPELASRLVEIDPASPHALLGLRDRIDAGQMIALLGDRAELSERRVTVDFLGSPARFPAGPYLLAALLECPVYLAVGLYTPPRRYDFHCELLFERVELPRERRDEVLAGCARRYAARLEHYCRMAPFDWFNFYGFWDAR